MYLLSSGEGIFTFPAGSVSSTMPCLKSACTRSNAAGDAVPQFHDGHVNALVHAKDEIFLVHAVRL